MEWSGEVEKALDVSGAEGRDGRVGYGMDGGLRRGCTIA